LRRKKGVSLFEKSLFFGNTFFLVMLHISDTESARDRKNRLAALRKAALSGEIKTLEIDESQSQISSVDPGISSEIKIKFRNYVPYDSFLEEKVKFLDKSDIHAKRQKGPTGNVVEQKGEPIDIIKIELKKLEKTEHILSEPKTIDGDLKQLVAGKLRKLRKRTQRAIVEIMRDKLSKFSQEQQ
jgi:hypothetical protein